MLVVSLCVASAFQLAPIQTKGTRRNAMEETMGPAYGRNVVLGGIVSGLGLSYIALNVPTPTVKKQNKYARRRESVEETLRVRSEAKKMPTPKMPAPKLPAPKLPAPSLPNFPTSTAPQVSDTSTELEGVALGAAPFLALPAFIFYRLQSAISKSRSRDDLLKKR